MLQYIGILLNEKRLLAMTNIVGDTLVDPWACDGMSRKMFKSAATPQLYGSSKACHELWQDRKMPYTFEQVQIYNQQLTTGPLGIANSFKEFLISNVKPKATMTVDIDGEQFTIECNRFRQLGELTKAYDIYDTPTKSVPRIMHTTTHAVPDLDRFRRYFVTLLIHNLDSQVADRISAKIMDKYGWGMDIHDAFLINPEAADDVRMWYAQELEGIHARRQTILTNYLTSIGIGSEAQTQWQSLVARIQPLEDEFHVNELALK